MLNNIDNKHLKRLLLFIRIILSILLFSPLLCHNINRVIDRKLSFWDAFWQTTGAGLFIYFGIVMFSISLIIFLVLELLGDVFTSLKERRKLEAVHIGLILFFIVSNVLSFWALQSMKLLWIDTGYLLSSIGVSICVFAYFSVGFLFAICNIMSFLAWFVSLF